MSRRNANPFRRTAIVSAVAAASTVVALVVPGLASAQEEFVAGSGRAKSTIIRLGPSAAKLSLAPSVGVTLADHIGTLGRGEALVFDYAALDSTVNNSAGDLKREFPSLRVESRDEGSEAGEHWEPKPGISEDAAATDAPVGRSAFTLENFDLPGIIEVSGAKARSFAGVYKRTKGNTEQLIRAAGGTVDIDRVELLGGQVVMSGLRWEAAQITDRNDDDEVEQLGSFYINKVVAQGEPVFNHITGAEVGQVFDGLNQGLGQIGITLVAPTIQTKAGVVTVKPLAIQIASETFKALVDPISNSVIGPVGQEFIPACQEQESGGEGEGGAESDSGGSSVDGLLGRVDPGGVMFANHGGQHEEFDELNSDGPSGREQDPEPEYPGPAEGGSDCGVPFLALDLALAPFGGGGQFDIELGGTLGYTEGAQFEGFDLFGTNSFEGVENIETEFGVSGNSGNSGGTVTPAPSGGSTPLPAAPPTGGGTQPPQGGEQAIGPQTVQLTGSRASFAWAVGLVGLGAAMAMAMSDYRRLSARRHTVTPIS